MIDKQQKKSLARLRRQRRVRAKVTGTTSRPRLNVYRSLSHIYAQLVDDGQGKTLASASDLALPKKERESLAKEGEGRKAKVAVAYAVGKMIAEKGKKAGIDQVVFDRNGFAYTGRVAALAEGARANGLKF